MITALPLLAVGLAMDATAVALTTGFTATKVRWRDALLLASLFGLFQGLMPAIGWLLGTRFERYISAWDHWLAFALLALIGAKMIREGLQHKGDTVGPPTDPFHPRPLLILAVATSIDALAAGITLPVMDLPLLLAISVIAAVTFLMSLLAVFAGRRFGDHLGGKLDVVGGVILIALGARTVFEHLAG
ncbi:MAG: manganese efflux pump MntP family protein [Myxococcota bacterium]|nr:manganese efflux pump MntP family protein [Myxococcota bacterium]